MEPLKGFLEGLGIALYIAIIVLAVLIVISKCAQAQELVKIDERDRTITSTAQNAGRDSMVDMMMIFSADSPETSVDGRRYEQSIQERCMESNELYAALKITIDLAVTAHPEHAEIYAPAYQALEEAHCND